LARYVVATKKTYPKSSIYFLRYLISVFVMDFNIIFQTIAILYFSNDSKFNVDFVYKCENFISFE